jgi:hypothetical protein
MRLEAPARKQYFNIWSAGLLSATSDLKPDKSQWHTCRLLQRLQAVDIPIVKYHFSRVDLQVIISAPKAALADKRTIVLVYPHIKLVSTFIFWILKEEDVIIRIF